MATACFWPTNTTSFLTPSDPGVDGVEEVPPQHRVVLRHDRDDHGWIFGTLAFVDRRGVGGHQHIQFTKPVGNGSAVKVGDELAIGGIDTIDVANVAVVVRKVRRYPPLVQKNHRRGISMLDYLSA